MRNSKKSTASVRSGSARLLRGSALALLLCGSGACYNPDDYLLDPDLVDGRLSLAVEGNVNAMFADGYSRVMLLADVGSSDGREVVFTTTAGELLGGRAESGGVVVNATGDGIARVELLAPTTPQLVRVRAALKAEPRISVEETLEAVPVVPDSIVRFTDVPAVVEADGADVVQITVRVAPGLQDERRTVLFRVSNGVLAGSGSEAQVKADASGYASVFLRSPDSTDPIQLLASVAGVTRDTVIAVVPALPTSIAVDAGSFTIQEGAEVTIKGRLRRPRGTVTAGTAAAFTARIPGGPDLGTFRSITDSDAEGNVTAVYSTGKTDYRGPLEFGIAVAGSTATGTARVEVVDPPETAVF